MIYALGQRRVSARGEYFVAANATVVGSVVLGNQASVWFNCVVRGDNDVITLGDNVNLQDGAVLHTDIGIPLYLHANVSVGHQAMLHGCTVGEGSLIGINAVVLNHAVVGKNCLIGANTLVAEGKKIPDGSLVVGSPARVLRPLTPEEIASVNGIAHHYVEKSRQYREQLQPCVP